MDERIHEENEEGREDQTLATIPKGKIKCQ
jgi:hypothetical protein